MPIFEFRCLHCEERFEALCRLSEVDEQPCPACGAREVRRLISTFASRVSHGNGGATFRPAGGGGG